MSTALTCCTNFSTVNLSLRMKHFLITLCAASHQTTDLYYSVVIHTVLSVSAGLLQPNTSGACCAGPVWLEARSTQPRACQEQRSTVVVLVHSQQEAHYFKQVQTEENWLLCCLTPEQDSQYLESAGTRENRGFAGWLESTSRSTVSGAGHELRHGCTGRLGERSVVSAACEDWRHMADGCWDKLLLQHTSVLFDCIHCRMPNVLVSSQRGLETHGWWLLGQVCATHISIVWLHPLENAQHFTERDPKPGCTMNPTVQHAPLSPRRPLPDRERKTGQRHKAPSITVPHFPTTQCSSFEKCLRGIQGQ